MNKNNLAIFAIKDIDMGITDIITYPNRMIAMRNFGDLVNNEKSALSQHPEKFELWEIGEIDDQTGEFTGSATLLEKAANLLKGSKPSNL